MLALAIVGLICIGVAGLALYLFYLRPSSQAQEAVVVATTPAISLPTPTPTFTITPIPPPPTNTPEPTPTPTLVVPVGQAAAQTEPSPTPPDITGGREAPTVSSSEAQPPTPISTLVVQPPTPVAPLATALPAQIPQGGGVLSSTRDSYLIGAGLVVLILLVWGLVNYLRSPSSLSGH